MSSYISSYSPALGETLYGLIGTPSCFSIGTPGAYLTSYSSSFGSYAPDLANTGGGMSGYTQLPADWAAVSGVTQILNKPTLSTVSATGSYSDLLNLPVISTVGHSGLYSDLTGQPVIITIGHTGNYTDILGLPVISTVGHSGLYSDLIGLHAFSTVGHSGLYSDLVGALAQPQPALMLLCMGHLSSA